MSEPEVEQIFDEFWRDIVMPNGVLDLDQVKRELFDYHMILGEVPKVYDAVTGGRISKPNTVADAVIGEFESYLERQIEDAMREAQQ
jgi:hypothetical protein